MADYSAEIIIKDETTNQESSPIANNGGGGGESTKNTSAGAGGNKDSGLEARKTVAKTYFAIKHIVAPFVTQGINYGISTISIRTGQVEQQQRAQFAYDVASKAFGMVESIAMGAAIGGLAGAIGGAVMSLATTITGYALQQQKLNLAESAENISLGFMNARAGGSVATTSGSRMG